MLVHPCVQTQYAGGSDNEWTLNENQAALGRYRLLPRVLVDVSTVDTSTELLGDGEGGNDKSGRHMLAHLPAE